MLLFYKLEASESASKGLLLQECRDLLHTFLSDGWPFRNFLAVSAFSIGL